MAIFLRLGVAVALLSSLVAAPGIAEELEPIDMTLYLQADQRVGESQANTFRRMDEEAPTEEVPASVQVVNYLAGPNTNCSGNGLFPTFQANLEGRLTGDVTVTLHTAAIPGAMLHVRLFTDGASGNCNDAYVPAVGEAIVQVAEGQSETVVVFEDLDVAVADNVLLMVSPPRTNVAMPPASPVGSPLQPFSHTRLFYDSVEMPSRVDLSCVPLTANADTCLWD